MRVRLAAVQYLMRPIQTWDDFAGQVAGLVQIGGDYKCGLIVFPEYFTMQLAFLDGLLSLPVDQQVREVAVYRDRYLELFSDLSRRYDILVCTGTIPSEVGNEIRNHSYLVGPGGDIGYQGKLHLTRFEREEWLVSPSNGIRVFDTRIGRLAITVCYDVEFPEQVRALALQEMELLT